MTKDLTISKLASLANTLTGKEVALLVIDYYLRGDKEGKDYTDEVKTIVSTINYSNPNRRSEYIFYYELWRTCGFYSLDLQTNIMNLEIYSWKLEFIKQLVFESCTKYLFSRFMNMLPKYYTQEQFNELYEKCKERIFAEQLPVETVAEYEAFHALKRDKLIPEKAYYGIDDVFGDDKNLEDKFEKYIDENLNTLEDSIKRGLLKEVKVTDRIGWYHSGEEYIGSRGITGESWYQYSKKLDKGYNEMVDNKGKLVEFYEGEAAIATGESSGITTDDKNICWSERHRQDLIGGLKKNLVISLENGIVSFDKAVEIAFEKLTEWTNECIQKTVNLSEVLKKVQEELFDDKIKLGDSTIEKAPGAIKRPKEVMEDLISHTLHSMELSVITKKPELKNIGKFQINTNPGPNKTFIQEQFKWLISMAEKESGYKFKM